MRKIRLIAIVLVALGLSLPMNIASAEPDIFSPSSEPFGFKFREWTAQWWQFVLSFPGDVNPLLDDTGERCTIGQRGPVWFLMGTVVGESKRTCSIPEGTALLFPVINSVDVNVTNQTAKELRSELAPCLDAVRDLSVEVDGKPIRKVKLKNHSRVRSEVFEITLPEGNVFGFAPGSYSPAVDDGYYVMLEPLAVGKHTLHFGGSTAPSAACIFYPDGFSVDVTYSLDIVPVSLK